MSKIRTDIAPEIIEDKNKAMFCTGVTSEITKYDNKITKHNVFLGDNNSFLRPKGTYITIDSPLINIENDKVYKKTTELLSEALKPFVKDKKNILVIGIGNRGLTSDSLGPKVSEQIEVTRGVNGQILPSKSKKLPLVSVFAPSVLGRTGIESFDVVVGLVKSINPQLVIVIDALCTRKVSRIGTSFQITDVGILPGSGIAASPNELSKKTLGCDVVAIGVPMVVYASELALDILFEERFENIEILNKFKKEVSKSYSDLVVTPKNIDEIVLYTSNTIACAINDCIFNNKKQKTQVRK